MTQPADFQIPLSGPSTPVNQATSQQELFDALLDAHIGSGRPSYAVQGTRWAKDTGVSPAVIEIYEFDGTSDILVATYDVLTSKISFPNYVGDSVASASTIIIPENGNYFSLTGTTTIANMTVAVNRSWAMKCSGGLTFTQSASIITEDGNDITTTAGQVLMFQSTAANTVVVTKAPSAVNVAGWDFVSAITASASATVEFTGFEAGFDYMVWIDKAIPADDGAQLSAEVGITGPTYRTANYDGGIGRINTSAGTSGSLNTSAISLTDAAQGNAADEFLVGHLILLDPVASTKTGFQGQSSNHGTTSVWQFNQFGGHHAVAESITAIQFQYDLGNTTSGVYKLYRKPNS